MEKIEKSQYTVYSKNIARSVSFAVVSDVHSKTKTDVAAIISLVEDIAPDYILMPGDIFERLDGTDVDGMSAGLELMRRCSDIAPSFYSIGNHENGGIRSWNKLRWLSIKSIPKYYDAEQLELIKQSGVIILDDDYVIQDGIAFGGLSSGLINEGRLPDVDFLRRFALLEEPKVLLCHHPEYFKKYLFDKCVDLIVSGHAHGGQWRVFDRGVFAPGQGIFPKYTSGIYHGSLAVSRGLKESGVIPRIFNSREVMEIILMPR